MNTGDREPSNRSTRKKTSRKRAAAVSIPKPDRQPSKRPKVAVMDNANENQNQNENTAPNRQNENEISKSNDKLKPVVVDYASMVVLTDKPKCKNHYNGYGQFIVPHMGKFTTHELEIIKQSVANFCASKNVPVSTLAEGNGAKKGNPLKGIWAEVGKELPHRHTHTIYRCGLRLIHDCKRGEWTNEEIQELKLLHFQHGNKWVQIGKKLNRTPDCCRDKFRESGNDGKVNGRFTKEEEERFLVVLKENLNLGQDATVEDMRKAVFEDGIAISWEGLSGAMKTRTRLQCLCKWESLMKTPRKRGPRAKKGGLGQGPKKEQEGDGGKVDVKRRKKKNPPTASDANAVEVGARKKTSAKVGGANNDDGDDDGDGGEEAIPVNTSSDASVKKKSKDTSTSTKKKKNDKKKKAKMKDTNAVEVGARKKTSAKVGGANNDDGDGDEEAIPINTSSDASVRKKSKDTSTSTKKKKSEKKKKAKKKRESKSIASLGSPDGNDDINRSSKKRGQEGDHLGRVDVRKRKRKLSSTASDANTNVSAVEVDVIMKGGGADTSDRVDIRKRRKKEAKQQLKESNKPEQSLANKKNDSNEKEEGSNNKMNNSKDGDDEDNASKESKFNSGRDPDVTFDFDDGDEEATRPSSNVSAKKKSKKTKKKKHKKEKRKSKSIASSNAMSPPDSPDGNNDGIHKSSKKKKSKKKKHKKKKHKKSSGESRSSTTTNPSQKTFDEIFEGDFSFGDTVIV